MLLVDVASSGRVRHQWLCWFALNPLLPIRISLVTHEPPARFHVPGNSSTCIQHLQRQGPLICRTSSNFQLHLKYDTAFMTLFAALHKVVVRQVPKTNLNRYYPHFFGDFACSRRMNISATASDVRMSYISV